MPTPTGPHSPPASGKPQTAVAQVQHRYSRVMGLGPSQKDHAWRVQISGTGPSHRRRPRTVARGRESARFAESSIVSHQSSVAALRAAPALPNPSTAIRLRISRRAPRIPWPLKMAVASSRVTFTPPAPPPRATRARRCCRDSSDYGCVCRGWRSEPSSDHQLGESVIRVHSPPRRAPTSGLCPPNRAAPHVHVELAHCRWSVDDSRVGCFGPR